LRVFAPTHLGLNNAARAGIEIPSEPREIPIMSVLAKIKSVPLPHGTAKPGLVGVAWDKGERYVASWGFGALKGYYGERFGWRGYAGDLLIGSGALAASVLLRMVSNGNSPAAAHLERVGDAGLQSYLNSMGAHWGMTKAGRSVAMAPPAGGGKKRTALTGDILGMIPPAMGGSYLNADDIARYSSVR
jgi:hypothetical protein